MDTWLDSVRARHPEAADAIGGEADALARRWDAGELGRANAVAYAAWHHLGTDGRQGGFLQLQRFAVRAAGGDTERGTDVAIATWLDVRERLDGLAERLRQERSVPDFRGPQEALEANCWRYHRVQARLRLQGRWSRATPELPAEVDALPAPPSEVAEARTHAVQLHVAAWWYLLDTRPRRTRSGHTKGASWWWSMLEHALDLTEWLDLGSDRNDPTEAMHRLRLRFAVCLGCGPWLRRWAARRPYWSQLAFALPDPDHPEREAVAELLDQLRPALSEAIEGLDADEPERRALAGCLLSGWNVRTALRRFRGVDAGERFTRMRTLATEAGMQIGRPPDARQRRLHRLAGEQGVPDAATVRAVVPLLRDPELRAEWVALAEAEPYLEALGQRQSASRRVARWVLVPVALAAVGVVLAVGSSLSQEPEVTLRGSSAAEVPAHLALGVQRVDGVVERLVGPIEVGDRVYFQLSAETTTPVELWVDGPEGRHRLATTTASPTPDTLSVGGGVLYYEVEAEGSYVFQVSSESDGQCTPPRCDRHVVVVGDP